MEIKNVFGFVKEKIKGKSTEITTLGDFYSYLEKNKIADFNAEIYKREQVEQAVKNIYPIGQEYGVLFNVKNPNNSKKFIARYSFPVTFLTNSEYKDIRKREEAHQKCLVVLAHKLRTKPEDTIVSINLFGNRINQENFEEKVQTAREKGVDPTI